MTTVRIIHQSQHPVPQYQTEGSAGMDLQANLPDGPIALRPMQRALIRTGICLELPKGLEAQVRPRSGLALKNGITVLNAPGTIDSDYRGEVGVILINLSEETYVIQNGDRVAQLIIGRYEQVQLKVVDELDDSERGAGGFGSTGR